MARSHYQAVEISRQAGRLQKVRRTPDPGLLVYGAHGHILVLSTNRYLAHLLHVGLNQEVTRRSYALDRVQDRDDLLLKLFQH